MQPERKMNVSVLVAWLETRTRAWLASSEKGRQGEWAEEGFAACELRGREGGTRREVAYQ